MDSKLFEITNKVKLNESFADDIKAVAAKMVSERIYNHLKIKLDLTTFQAEPDDAMWTWKTTNPEYAGVNLNLSSGAIYLVKSKGETQVIK